MPDDCGVKPSNATLPPIAQEEDILVLETADERWFGSEPVLPSAGRLGWKARAGRYDSTRRAPRQSGPGRSDDTREDARGVPSNPTNSTPGRSLVTRRAVVDIVRAA